ncbi:hypothetical protein Q3G72_014746 [Acer saccharum]|jgi:excisionase family DNA binding protein|nr:hypothetical protein Q3G72_014746 [Acer saccharum]
MDAHAVLTTFQVGQMLGVATSSINYWTRAKGLECYRTPGGHRRIVVRDLAAFLLAWNMPQPFIIQEPRA